MKGKTILICLIGIIPMLFGCGKESTQKLDEMVSADGILQFTGTFRGYGSENVSGLARIYLTKTNTC